MKIKSVIAVILTASCAYQVSHAANKEEVKATENALKTLKGLNINDWSQSFRTAVKKNDKQELARLLDFKALEKQALISADLINKDRIEKARDLFAAKKFDEAIELYSQIPRGSDYWFQAVEEKGWSFYRKNQTEKAIAQSRTLLSPPFSEVVNSESYFLQSLSLLKICDYKSVFATHQLFKEKQKNRISEIQKLSETGYNDTVKDLMEKAEQFPLTGKDLAATLLHLPVLYFKDLNLQANLLKYKLSAKALEILISESSNLQSLPKALEKLNQDSLEKFKKRMAVLASEESTANKKIVQKLNLIEVEAIQRIHTDLSINKDLYSKGKFKDAKEDDLVFMDDGLPWIDELDKFEVAAKACPQNLRRKM